MTWNHSQKKIKMRKKRKVKRNKKTGGQRILRTQNSFRMFLIKLLRELKTKKLKRRIEELQKR